MSKKVSSKFFKRGLAAGALNLVALGSSMQASQAAVLYDHTNLHLGETWSDRISALR